MSAATTTTALNQRSVRALYAGMTGPLLTVGVIQAVNFALYDSFRRVLHRARHPDASPDEYLRHDAYGTVALSAFGAGGLISLFTSPLQVVKTKQQIMVWTYRRALIDTYRGGGVNGGIGGGGMRNFFTGFGPHLFCESVGRMVYFTTYEMLKRGVKARNAAKGEAEARISLSERMACAALSGMACWTVIFPADAIRCKMYAASLSSSSRAVAAGPWELAATVYRENGSSVRPFFRGFGVTVARAGPVAAAVMPVYDLSLEWLSTPYRTPAATVMTTG